MTDTPDMTERHAAILAELAEIGMVMARGLRAEAETAETPEAKAQAVTAYPRVARAVRQTLALEARLKRDARREAVEVLGQARRGLDLRIRRRKALVRTYMQRAIANDTPDDDDTIHTRLEDLRDRLDLDLLDETFADRPVEDVIADLHIELGLAPPDFGPEAPEDDGPEDEGADEGPHVEGPQDPPPAPEPYFRYSSG